MHNVMRKRGQVGLDAALARAEQSGIGERLRALAKPEQPCAAFERELAFRLRQSGAGTAPGCHAEDRRLRRGWGQLPLLPQRGRPRIMVTQMRLASVQVALAVLLFGTLGAGLAYRRIIDPPRLDRVRLLAPGMMTEINQTQVGNGYAVTLRRAYADANIVAVSWVVRDTQGRVVTDLEPNLHAIAPLLAADGTPLPPADYLRDDRSGSIIELDPGVFGAEYYFRTGDVRPTGGRLDLRLTLEFARPNGKVFATPAQTTDWYGPSYEPATPPLTFTFGVPFHGGTIVPLGVTHTIEGLTVAFERVTIAPSGGAVRICVAAPQPLDRWHVYLATKNGERIATAGVRDPLGADCGIAHLDGVLTGRGDHALTVLRIGWRIGDRIEERPVAWTIPFRLP